MTWGLPRAMRVTSNGRGLGQAEQQWSQTSSPLAEKKRSRLAPMDVNGLLALRPKLQRDHLGQPAYWAIAEDVARLLDREVGPGSSTLETGGGGGPIILAMNAPTPPSST